jgi:alpha-L-fucosidase
MPNGEIEPRQVAVLREIGAWLKKYGESIYATRGGPFRNGEWGGSTRKGNLVYLHVFKWNDGRLTLPPLEARVRKSAVLSGGRVEVSQTAEGIVIVMPGGKEERPSTIVKLEFDRPIDQLHSLEVRPR